MAATILKRSAVIWVPPRSVGERALASDKTLVLTLPPESDGVPRSARTSLEALPALRAVTLLFDARDVTLLPVNMPPLSGTRLARALPNLVEDSLLQEAQACALALGPRLPDGRRLLAVIDRNWLEFVIGAFERRGVRVAAAWPAQLALPLAPGGWTVACVNGGLAVRTGEAEGFGWSAAGDATARVEALSCALDAAAQTGAPADAVQVHADTVDWQASVQQLAARGGMPLRFGPLPLPDAAPVDLLSARQGSAGSRWLAGIDWRAWRLPAAIAAACLVAWLAGLNLHWGSLSRERAALRAEMEQVFRDAFPSAQVVVDPLLQMRRQVGELRLATGQSGPGDFLPLMAAFSEALGPRAVDGVAAIEYRDGRLRIRLREGFLDGPSATDNLRAACRQRGLALEPDPQQPSTVVVGPST